MKKDMIFTPVLLLIAIALFMLKATGMAAHMIISVAGILVLAVYTAAAKKTWKIPALEIIMRACYGIALITGIVVMNVRGIAAITIVHKASAALFVVLLVVLFAQKLIAARK